MRIEIIAMGTEPRFKFYEKVKITSTSSEAKEVFGEIAAVLARTVAASEQGEFNYTVYVYRDEICRNFKEGELEPTGQFDTMKSFINRQPLRFKGDEEDR